MPVVILEPCSCCCCSCCCCRSSRGGLWGQWQARPMSPKGVGGCGNTVDWAERELITGRQRYLYPASGLLMAFAGFSFKSTSSESIPTGFVVTRHNGG